MNELREATRITLRDCLGLKDGEEVLIVTDAECMEVAQSLFDTSAEQGSVPLLIEIPVGRRDGEEPPELVGEMMKRVDVVIAPTLKSITHTRARREASAAGARVATMPGITPEIMVRTMKVDYHGIAQVTHALAELLSSASRVVVRTRAGTDVELSIKGRTGLSDTGLIHHSGDFSNLPAGEAYLAPVEGSTNGIIVVDGSMAGVGKLEEGDEITIVVERGVAREIRGGASAERFKGLIDSVGENGGNVAELGIGTNNRAIISGVVLEDEKVLGTAHIAFGNNLSMGGSIDVPLHLDGVLIRPTIEIDGRIVLNKGEIDL